MGYSQDLQFSWTDRFIIWSAIINTVNWSSLTWTGPSVLPSEASWIDPEFHKQPNPVQRHVAPKKGSSLSFLAPRLFQLSHLLEIAFQFIVSMILLYQTTPRKTLNTGEELYCLLLFLLDSFTWDHMKLSLRADEKYK